MSSTIVYAVDFIPTLLIFENLIFKFAMLLSMVKLGVVFKADQCSSDELEPMAGSKYGRAKNAQYM